MESVIRRHHAISRTLCVARVLMLTLLAACMSPAAQARRAPADDIRTLRDLPYGADPAQRIDAYLPAQAHDAPMPIIVMVHGGAWRFGDKASPGVIARKAAHWVPQGFIVVSVDYRMLPAAQPLEQAEDVGRALAFVEARASSWGGDARRIVLMGHSAGAHLVALLASAPAVAAGAGARRWRATVVLDTAALDVERLMEADHARLYDRAFGPDAGNWRAASPYARLSSAPAPMLLVCSTLRTDSCPQTDRFAAKVAALGGHASVLRVARTHLQINRDIGGDNDETREIDRFIADQGVRDAR